VGASTVYKELSSLANGKSLLLVPTAKWWVITGLCLEIVKGKIAEHTGCPSLQPRSSMQPAGCGLSIFGLPPTRLFLGLNDIMYDI